MPPKTTKGPQKGTGRGTKKIVPKHPKKTSAPAPAKPIRKRNWRGQYAKEPASQKADKKPAAPVSVSEAKNLVAQLIATSQKDGIRPRDLAELYRVYSSLSELEAKLSAEDVEGIQIIDVDPDGVQVVAGVRMVLVPEKKT